MKSTLLDSNIWKLLCSLKLTITLASAITMLAIGGSVVMPFNPEVFGDLDSLPLGTWIARATTSSPWLAWWIPVAGILTALLGLNTLCCVIDWICHLRARWRKAGEYLIHIGFVCVLAAFLWGSLAGFRSAGVPLFAGQMKPLSLPGLALQLAGLEPVYNAAGRPVDMISDLILYRDGQVLKRVRARINHPLTWRGLVVLPASYGQAARGGRPVPYALLTMSLTHIES